MSARAEGGPDEAPRDRVAALEVRDLRKHYAKHEAVRGISFSVARGEIFGLLGPNGAGKTTTMEIVMGLREATSGRVSVLGVDVAEDRPQTQSQLGVQLQDSDFFEHLTLAEQLDYLGSCYGRRPDERALLDYVNLLERADWRLDQLSGGQQQRFAIAAALVNNPPIVLLDEPSTGLDPTARRDLWTLIRDLRDDGRTIVLSTHYMEEAEALCDRVAIMDQGLIAAIDTPSALIDDLVSRGFRREVEARAATLEDVFVDVTGHQFEDESVEADGAGGRE